jgi:hypothetical protein
MARQATPIDIWLGGLEMGQLMLETQMVMTYRILGLAGLWTVNKSENRRMVAEKAPAFIKASQAASAAAARGARPDEVVAAWVQPLRRATSSNAKRLGKSGPRFR